MTDPIEIQGAVQPEQPVSQEQLNSWLETGRGNNPQSFCGVSIEVLNHMIRTGSIPRWKDNLEKPHPLFSLIGDYRYVYYVNPIEENMLKFPPPQSNPDLVNRLGGWFGRYGPIDSAQNYARMNAICDGFYKATERYVEISDLVTIANLVLPKEFKTVVDELMGTIPFVEKDEDIAKRILREKTDGIDKSKVTKALKDCIERQGTLLFFNGKLLDQHMEQDPEGDSWLMVFTKNPLSVDVISGVEILSAADKEVLEDQYK